MQRLLFPSRYTDWVAAASGCCVLVSGPQFERHHMLVSATVRALGAATMMASLIAVGSTSPAAAETPSATVGLYESADATYNGVFRQSMALLALRQAGRTPHVDAVSWLVNQQCDNGSFTSYRGDLSVECAQYDPVSYVGMDTNATALAAVALDDLGRTREYRAAVSWLLSVQNTDGGWAMNPFSDWNTSESNSTGLVLAALQAVESWPAKEQAIDSAKKSARAYLAGVQSPCTAEAANQGGYAFDSASPVPNALASAQAALGSNGLEQNEYVRFVTVKGKQVVVRDTGRTLKVNVSGKAYTAPAGATHVKIQGKKFPIKTRVARPDALALPALCSTQGKVNGLRWLAQQLQTTGALPDPYSPGEADVAATAYALIALGKANASTPVVGKALGFLRDKAAAYTGEVDKGGRLALLALAWQAARPDADSSKPFGGVRLIAQLEASRQA